MKSPSHRSFSTPLALASALGVSLAVLWVIGSLTSLQSIFVLDGGADGGPVVPLGAWLVLPLIVAGGVGAAFVVARFGGRRTVFLIAAALAALAALSVVLSRAISLDIAFLPVGLAVAGGAAISQIYKLWSIDDKLSRHVGQIVRQIHAEPDGKDPAKTPEGGMTVALKLLEAVLPLNEAVVLRADEDGTLQPAARVQSSPIASAAEASRNSAWREGVSLCERAIRTGEMIVSPAVSNGNGHSPAAAIDPPATASAASDAAGGNGSSVALPLRHQDQTMGALLVRLRENFSEGDGPLLGAVGAQLARDIYRDRARAYAGQPPQLPTTISSGAAERRLFSIGSVYDLARKERMTADLLEEMPDAHAVAYLDGSIIYANSNMLREADLKEADLRALDLFALLDRFRGGVFDEPTLAVRRVLQSGEPYEREIFFSERDQTLRLRIAPINDRDNGARPRPLCFLVSVSDVTRQKEFVNLKSDMVSLMSHELRTPITSINGFAELLVIDKSLSEESREFLQIIRQESQRLSRMIDTFLEVSKLEAGDKQTVAKAPLLINDLVHETILALQPIAKKKRIRLTERPQVGLPLVAADRGLITQVISNLVDNAIKYSPERTTVTLSTELETDAVRVTVEDRGYGIPPESIDRVWEKFYRVAREGQEAVDSSTGLGLSFVREVIEQHGGQISLESEVNRGSLFSFTLPRL